VFFCKNTAKLSEHIKPLKYITIYRHLPFIEIFNLIRKWKEGIEVCKRIALAAVILFIAASACIIYKNVMVTHSVAEAKDSSLKTDAKARPSTGANGLPKKDVNGGRTQTAFANMGSVAPDFTLPTMDGKTLSLSSFKGKKVILNFWATWCAPCRQEMPEIEAFYKKLTGGNVVVLAVNLTAEEMNPDDVTKFVKDYQLTFPILLAQSQDIEAAYQVMTIPTSYIIDSKGIIRNQKIGPMTQEWMNEQLSSVQ